MNLSHLIARPVRRQSDRMPLLKFRGKWYDHLPTPESVPVPAPVDGCAPVPASPIQQAIRERGITTRQRKVMNKALRELREGPQPKTTGTHQDMRGTAVGLSPREMAAARAHQFPAPEPTTARAAGKCQCGCDLIRDAEFDLSGNATGKLTWLCIRCEHAPRLNEPDNEGRVGE